MTDWPLMTFVVCCGALIMFIGLMSITDLDSFFAALAAVIDAVTALPGLLADGIDNLLQDAGTAEGSVDAGEKAPAAQGKPSATALDEEGAMTEEVRPRP